MSVSHGKLSKGDYVEKRAHATSPICSLRFFPGIARGNARLNHNVDLEAGPRITEITGEEQELDDADSLDIPITSLSQSPLPTIETHEEPFEPLNPGKSVRLQRPNLQVMKNSHLQLQLDQLRASQIHRKRLKLELLERQKLEREELEARETEANDLTVLKRVHIIKSHDLDEGDEQNEAMANLDVSPSQRLLEARMRLFADSDYTAFLTRGLTPRLSKRSPQDDPELDNPCAWALIEASNTVSVGMV